MELFCGLEPRTTLISITYDHYQIITVKIELGDLLRLLNVDINPHLRHHRDGFRVQAMGFDTSRINLTEHSHWLGPTICDRQEFPVQRKRTLVITPLQEFSQLIRHYGRSNHDCHPAPNPQH